MAKVKVTVKRTGGKKLERFLREAGKGGVSSVAVGFFADAKYQDGTPVAAVAAWNEFGTKNIPERPFFRNALAESERGVSNILAKGIDTKRWWWTTGSPEESASTWQARCRSRSRR